MATAAEGASYDYMQNFMDDVTAATVDRVPEAHLMMTQVPGFGGANGVSGPVNNGFVRVFLKDRADRQRSQSEIAADLQAMAKRFNGARVNITQEASIGDRRSAQAGVQYVVQALEIEELREVLPKFLEEVKASPVFTFTDADLKFNKPEVKVRIDRAKRLAHLTVRAPKTAQPAALAGIVAAGAGWWPLQMGRELDDAILFDSGKSELKAEGQAALAQLGCAEEYKTARETLARLKAESAAKK